VTSALTIEPLANLTALSLGEQENNVVAIATDNNNFFMCV
jgi:hypothetical protein